MEGVDSGRRMAFVLAYGIKPDRARLDQRRGASRADRRALAVLERVYIKA